jgi:ubiquinol-cytochrome c reductase cytochrome b subunit
MSFWGATVITNLLSPFPGVIEWLCGGYCVHSPTIKRFFVFHFVLPFVLLGFVLLHLFYLHFHSSSNPLRLNGNNKIPFFPYVFIKDFFTLIIILTFYLTQCHFGMSTLSHPDNALEACAFLTPLHIVPEWYFLCQYSILKAIPSKNGGFLALIISVLCLFCLTEILKFSPLKRLMTSIGQNNSTTLFFCIFICFLVFGAQFPQEIFLSYARSGIGYYFYLVTLL